MLTKLQIDKVRYAYCLIDEVNTLFHTPQYRDSKTDVYHSEYILKYIYLYLEGLANNNIDRVYEVTDLADNIELELLDANSLLFHSAHIIKMLSEYALLVLKGQDKESIQLANDIFEYFKSNVVNKEGE